MHLQEERDRHFQAVLDTIPVAVLIADTDGRIVVLNRAVHEIWGESVPISEELADYRHYEGWWADSERRLEADEWALARTLRSGKRSGPDEVVIRTIQGEWKTILNTAYPIHSGERLVGAIAVSEEITEQRRAEGHLSLLAEAGGVLTSSLEIEETIDRAARVSVPRLADWCMIYGFGEGIRSSVHLLGLAGSDPELEAKIAEFERRYPLGQEHPLVDAIREGAPLLIPNFTESLLLRGVKEEEHLRLIHEIGFRSLMLIPLVARGRKLGALLLCSAESGRVYSDRELSVAKELAQRTATALDNARLYRVAEESRGEAERRAREEAALREATEAVTACFTVEEVVEQIAVSALAATGADGAFVERVDLERGEVFVSAAAGGWTAEVGARRSYEGSILQGVVERNEPELITELAATGRELPVGLPEGCGVCSAVVVPLIDAGEAFGALFLLRSPERSPFRPDEAERAHTFANLASLAFRKVHLLEDSEERRGELEYVMESRARLLRGFTHDVKNPIGAAAGHLQLLEEGIHNGLGEGHLESVSRALRALSSAIRLLDDLLEFARAEVGDIRIRLKPADLRSTVEEVAEEYRMQAVEKGLIYLVDLPESFPLTLYDADRTQQILGNLISNAVKYTATGEVRIGLGLVEGGTAPGSPGPWATISVIDTGPGIPEGKEDLIFREFGRLHDESGAGIGLAISQRLAEAMGGKITLEPAEGGGSVFTLWLPLH